MKLRATFVHVHRTAVKHRSIQCRNSGLGFRRLGHLHESDAPRFARIPVLDDGDGFDGTVACKQFPQLLLRHSDIEVSDKDVSHEFILFLSRNLAIRNERGISKAISTQIAFRTKVVHSERPHVFSLQALGTLRNVELYRLALLQALEPACLDCREVHKNIFATLAADEAVALGVVEPLYCSLFCHMDIGVPFD